MDIEKNKTAINDFYTKIDCPKKNLYQQRRNIIIDFSKKDVDKQSSLCRVLLISITIMIIGLSYLVLTVLGLVETDKLTIEQTCPNSSLWVYSLLSILLVPILNISLSKCTNKKNIYNKILGHGMSILVSGLFLGWCVYEVFFIDCVKRTFSDTLLYKMSISSLCLQIIIVIYHITKLILIIFKSNN